MAQPWDRLPGESAKAFAAFFQYRNLGSRRSPNGPWSGLDEVEAYDIVRIKMVFDDRVDNTLVAVVSVRMRPICVLFGSCLRPICVLIGRPRSGE